MHKENSPQHRGPEAISPLSLQQNVDGQQTNTDLALTQTRLLAIKAKARVYGVSITQTKSGFIVSRWGYPKWVTSLEEAEAFLTKMEMKP